MTAEDDILKTLDALELDNMTREIEQLVQLAKGKGLPEEARGAFQQAEGQIQGVEAEAKEAGGEDKGDKRDEEERGGVIRPLERGCACSRAGPGPALSPGWWSDWFHLLDTRSIPF